jgi:hypothetical protein
MVANFKRASAPIMNERGMATIETIPLLVLFVFLMAYTLGGFGVVHTAIKNNIAARTYAFETFRNRTDLTYFRDTGDKNQHYANNGARAHAIVSEAALGSEDRYIASERPLRVGVPSSTSDIKNARDAWDEVHNKNIYEQGAIATGKRISGDKLSVNPVWVTIQYGMCLNVRCGG